MEFTTNALQYVKNTNGGATKERFMEDHEPIGDFLWNDIRHLITTDENGRIWLNEAGTKQLQQQE